MKIKQILRSASEFQQSVDERDMRVQLMRELAGEVIVAVTELNAGLFNNSYRVVTAENRYILKVAPAGRADVFYNERHLMQRERTLAQQLQALSRLIPDYLAFFTIDGRDAFLQPLIAGRLWHDEIAALSEAENSALWQQLGAFAKRLHGVSGEQFGYPAPFNGHDHWSAFIADNVRGMVADCRRLGVYSSEVESYCAHLPRFFATLDQVKTPKLLHGDLWPRNVIIDGASANVHIKAVIDAERAFWGDPISDWVLILYDLPDAFWLGYGENLLETGNPAMIAVYRGMYFILNILESVRFQTSADEPRQNLAGINQALAQLR